jgi:nucleoid-associated protein YgaU
VFARIVVIIAFLTLAVAWGARQSDGAGHRESYVVQTGDTLWAIAAAHYAGDPREGVYRLEQQNHLAGALVRPGQRLVLP